MAGTALDCGMQPGLTTSGGTPPCLRLRVTLQDAQALALIARLPVTVLSPDLVTLAEGVLIDGVAVIFELDAVQTAGLDRVHLGATLPSGETLRRRVELTGTLTSVVLTLDDDCVAGWPAWMALRLPDTLRKEARPFPGAQAIQVRQWNQITCRWENLDSKQAHPDSPVGTLRFEGAAEQGLLHLRIPGCSERLVVVPAGGVYRLGWCGFDEHPEQAYVVMVREGLPCELAMAWSTWRAPQDIQRKMAAPDAVVTDPSSQALEAMAAGYTALRCSRLQQVYPWDPELVARYPGFADLAIIDLAMACRQASAGEGDLWGRLDTALASGPFAFAHGLDVLRTSMAWVKQGGTPSQPYLAHDRRVRKLAQFFVPCGVYASFKGRNLGDMMELLLYPRVVD